MKKQYLFIDGYNLLFRMKEYGLIKSSTFPAERDMLIDICANTQEEIIILFIVFLMLT